MTTTRNCGKISFEYWYVVVGDRAGQKKTGEEERKNESGEDGCHVECNTRHDRGVTTKAVTSWSAVQESGYSDLEEVNSHGIAPWKDTV